MKILITGSTGFIGKRLTHKLKADHELYLLVKKTSLEKARNLFGESPTIHYVIGDISNNDVLEQVGSVQLLNEHVDSVIHMAATYDLEASVADVYTHNVIGTQNLLFLMRKMKSLKYFHYISTYAVSGLHEGEFLEEQVEQTNKFPDHYAKSKMQAELLVRNTKLPDVKKRIYRPGMVVGDSQTGEMSKVDGPYYFFRFFSQLAPLRKKIPVKIFPVSCHPNALLPLIPVDTLTEWLSEMISHPTEHEVRTYHLLPEEKIFIPAFIEECFKYFDIDMRVQRIPFPELYAKILPYLSIPAPAAAYMQSKTRYNRRNIKEDFPKLRCPKLVDYLPRLIESSKGMFK